MNEENEWDQMVATEVLEGPVKGITRKETVKTMQKKVRKGS